jgi:hypothetical protein
MDFDRRRIGRLFRASEKQPWAAWVDQGPAVRPKLLHYARLTTVIAEAGTDHSSLEAAIESEFGWDAWEQDGLAARRLAKPLDRSNFLEFRVRYPLFRPYTPKFLEKFPFEAIPAQEALLQAVDVLRQMNRQEQNQIPADAPRSFFRSKWDLDGPEDAGDGWEGGHSTHPGSGWRAGSENRGRDSFGVCLRARGGIGRGSR